MDFKDLMDNAKKLKDKASIASKQAIDYSAGKLADSSLTIKNTKELELFIQKSKTTTGKDSQTGKDKKFMHKAIVIFADVNGEFFKGMLLSLPVLSAKAFSQNISLKMADISMKDLDSKKYDLGKKETLCVFEDCKVVKTLVGTENIQKVVKSMSLDINKSIEGL